MSTAAKIRRALPFWMSLLLVPIAILGALIGGWTVVLLPIVTWYFFSLLDAFLGLNLDNMDPDGGGDMTWYRAITLVWAPVQFTLLFWMIWYVPQAAHLGAAEKIMLFFGVGVITGTVGINYAHELMHQKPKIERWMGDMLLAMVLYSHFRSEHLQVHHRHVATPRDTATARYNEGFHRFFFRALPMSLKSAFRAEAAMQARRGHAWTHLSNPFFRY